MTSVEYQNCRRAGCDKIQKMIYDYLIGRKNIHTTYKHIEKEFHIPEYKIRVSMGFLQDKGLIKYTQGKGYTITQHTIYYIKVGA